MNNKICIRGQVPRSCAEDIAHYYRLFDTCPVFVRVEDPNFKAVRSMQAAVDVCAGHMLLASMFVVVVVIANMAMVELWR